MRQAGYLATVLLLAALFPWERSPSWVTSCGAGRSLFYAFVFPRWGCTKSKGRGALGEQALKIGHYFQKNNFALPTGPVQKSTWRSGQLRRVPCSWLQPCPDALWTWAEETLEGYLPLFPCCHWEDGMLTACQARSGTSAQMGNTEFLVVYVTFRSSGYIQNITVYLVILRWAWIFWELEHFPQPTIFVSCVNSLTEIFKSCVVVECMQLPPGSADKFGLSLWFSSAAKAILRWYFNGSSVPEHTWIIWFMAYPDCLTACCVGRFRRKYKLL